MKNFILLVLFSVINFTTIYSQDNYKNLKRINIDNPPEYLPEYLIDIYLGISFNEFTSIKDTLFLEKIKSSSSEWFGFREDVNDYYLDHIIYKFDATPDSLNDSLPLYQINLFYTEIEELNNFAYEKFGNPLFENEDSSQWILKTNKNFVLIVKKKNYEIKLIATIAGTEWDPKD